MKLVLQLCVDKILISLIFNIMCYLLKSRCGIVQLFIKNECVLDNLQFNV